MDKMTIVGVDGKAKYELAPDNSITDVRNHCTCVDTSRPVQVDGEQRVCLLCGLKIT